MFRITEIVKHLIIINVIFFLASLSIGGGELLPSLFDRFFLKNELFRPWQFLTSVFMHSSPQHLFFNMLFLFFFGTDLEMSVGKTKFLFLYLSAGIGSGILFILINYIRFSYLELGLVNDGFISNDLLKMIIDNKQYLEMNSNQESSLKAMFRIYYTSSSGASGALMGILASLAYLNPNKDIFLFPLPFPIKIKYLAVGVIGGDFSSSILANTPLLSNSRTGYLTHVCGALIGLIIAWYWKKNQFNKNRLY